MLSQEQMIKKYSRRIKRSLPDYDLPRPPGPFTLHENMYQRTELPLKSDSECCIIFPLYMAYNGIIPHYVINSSFWAAHSWRVNTDIIEKGWDIWFFVDERLWVPEVEAMFEKANLRDFVILFDYPDGRVIRHNMGLDLYATTLPMFKNYYRVYMVDTDLFPSVRNPQHLIETQQFLNIGDDESLFMTNRYSHNPDGHRNIARQKYEFQTEAEARPIYNAYVKEYLGYIPKGMWTVSGQLFAWNPQQLRQDFKEMVIQLTPNISDDEEQYGFYLEKTGLRPQELGKLWNVPIHYSREDYFSDEPHYFDHVWLSPNTADEKKRNEWKKGDILTREQDPLLSYDAPDIKHIWHENIGLNRRL